jgi:hypothetical protein
MRIDMLSICSLFPEFLKKSCFGRFVQMKVTLFACQELSNDVETQIKGVVLIGFLLERSEKFPTIDMKLMKLYGMLSGKIMPIRISAMHICIRDDPWFRFAAAVILRMLPVNFRLRSRIHVGKTLRNRHRHRLWDLVQ